MQVERIFGQAEKILLHTGCARSHSFTATILFTRLAWVRADSGPASAVERRATAQCHGTPCSLWLLSAAVEIKCLKLILLVRQNISQ